MNTSINFFKNKNEWPQTTNFKWYSIPFFISMLLCSSPVTVNLQKVQNNTMNHQESATYALFALY